MVIYVDIDILSDIDSGIHREHLTVPLVTAVPAVLVAVTDRVGVQTEPVITAEVSGLTDSYVQQ